MYVHIYVLMLSIIINTNSLLKIIITIEYYTVTRPFIAKRISIVY